MREITKFIFEMGLMGKLRRTGPYHAGVEDPETIAQHSHRAAIIAFILAKLEKCDPYKAAMMCILHDTHEVRTGDSNKIVARYIDSKKGERKAFQDQVSNLPQDIKKEFTELFMDFEDKKTKEANVAKDADYLECAFTSKEYLERGYPAMQDWIDNVKKVLKTKSAKAIIKQMEKTKPWDWWEFLKKIER